MFKIEDNIELPEAIPFNGKQGRKRLYPFKELALGQSFFVPDDGRGLTKLQNTLSSIGRTAFGATGHVATRKVEERGVSGIRVWRVK